MSQDIEVHALAQTSLGIARHPGLDEREQTLQGVFPPLVDKGSAGERGTIGAGAFMAHGALSSERRFPTSGRGLGINAIQDRGARLLGLRPGWSGGYHAA